MEVKELRIGNLVRFKDTKEVQHIYELEHRYKTVYRINDLNNNEELEPIPLTEEWLLKFGFKKIDHISGYSFYSHKKHRISIKDNSTTWMGYMIKHCEYVHQLQNFVFVSTGEELELK